MGIAREAEQAVHDERQLDGIEAVYGKRADRLQGAADLYWSMILGCNNHVKLDAYMQRWGWLQASALRAYVELRKMEKQGNAVDVTELLRGGNGNEEAQEG